MGLCCLECGLGKGKSKVDSSFNVVYRLLGIYQRGVGHPNGLQREGQDKEKAKVGSG